MKKQLFPVWFLSIAFVFSVITGPAEALTTIYVAGDITADTTWAADTVKVTGDLILADDVTLTIKSGTYVEFQGYYGMRISGILHAAGAEGDSICFSIHDTTGFDNPYTLKGSWKGMNFNNGSGEMSDNDSSIFSYCIIEYTKDTTFVTDPRGRNGGLRISNFSKIRISNSVFRKNSNNRWGGAILIQNADITIINNLFENNKAMAGGAIAMSNSNSIITGNEFKGNRCYTEFCDYEWRIECGAGGAIYLWNSASYIEGNIFQFNKAKTGAGIFCGDSKPLISSNIISNNQGYVGNSQGGGVFCVEGSKPVLVNNLIINNYAHEGGGIEVQLSQPTIINNLIANNSSGNEGGGISCHWSRSPHLINNTIVNNTATHGGGIWCQESELILVNNIIWGNSASEGNQLYLNDNFSEALIYYCNIEDSISSVGPTGFHGLYENSIKKDPEFILESGGKGWVFDALNGDWSLKGNSSCINLGMYDMSPYLLPEQDLSGNKRIHHGRIDMGAYEKHISSVSASGAISTDTTWIADTVFVTDDIHLVDNYTLTVAPGVTVAFMGSYSMNIEGTLLAKGTRQDSIKFTVYDTTGFSVDSIRDGGWHGLVFDNGPYGANNNMLDNDTSKLEYCIIEYGKKIDSSEQIMYSFLNQGGAIKVVYFPGLQIRHCKFRNNYAPHGGAIFTAFSEVDIQLNEFQYNKSYRGGGIHSFNSGSRITENRFISNTAEHGGGLYLENDNSVIQENIFHENISTRKGGGMFIGYSSSDIISNFFTNNYSAGENSEGGGLYMENSDNISINNNLFANNQSEREGAAIIIRSATGISFNNNTVVNNFCNLNGSAFYTSDNSIINGINDIFKGNNSDKGPPMWVGLTCQAEFNHCNIEGGSNAFNLEHDGIRATINAVLDTIPDFREPSDGAGIQYNGLTADWSLNPTSPFINAGWGDIEELDLPVTDLSGNPRIHSDVIDIGAYENQYGLPEITEHPSNFIKCTGDSVSFITRTARKADFQWQKDGYNIPDATDSVYTIDSLALSLEGNYQCIVRNGFGTIKGNAVYLLVKEAPSITIEPADQWINRDISLEIEVHVTGTMPFNFQWYKNDSLIPGASLTRYVIESPGLEDEGVYVCRISNTCGSAETSPASIYTVPQICMVTVSTTSGNNLIIWENNSIAPIVSFNIYRESKYVNIYDLLGSVSATDLGILIDSTADPTVQAYLYKITAVDSAGFETDIDLCNAHKTIHLLASTNPETNAIQLAWDRYIGFDYGSYEIFRSDATMNFTSIHLMASSTTTWSDANPGEELKYYRIAAIKPDPCYLANGKKAGTGPYYHSLSNMDDNKKLVSPSFPESAYQGVIIRPNPFSESAMIAFPNDEREDYTLEIYNLQGSMVRKIPGINENNFRLYRENLERGLYFVQLKGPEFYTLKIIIE